MQILQKCFDQSAEEAATSSISKKREQSSNGDELEHILNVRASVVLERLRFDDNLNEWIVPKMVTANEANANQNAQKNAHEKH